MENKPHISQEELELIERFWRRQFQDEAEEIRLMDRYAQDEAWRAMADEVRLVILSVQETALEDRLDDFHRYAKSQTPVKRITWSPWAVAAIVMSVVAVGLLFLFDKSPEEKLFAQYYEPDAGLPTLMGTSDDYVFDEAMVAYKMKEYDKALAAWQALLAGETANDTLNYYIGSAYLAKGRADSAIVRFQKVTGVPESAFLSDAHWYLALAWLKEDNKAAAVNALQQTEHPGKKDLLRELEP